MSSVREEEGFVMRKDILRKISQEQIIAAAAVVFFIIFALLVPGFFSKRNLITLFHRIAVLGIFSVGMAIVIIGRGIDLSQIAMMAAVAGTVLQMLNAGIALPYVVMIAFLAALLMGALNGYIIAFIEIPALFATLASGIFYYGVIRVFILHDAGYFHVPVTCKAFLWFGQSRLLGIPLPVYWFGLILLIIHLFLSKTVLGRFIYAQGDNPKTARITGISVRTMIILEYSLCALIGVIAGLIRTSMVAGIDLRVVNSTLIFDVILVVVLGGISLIGGRGSMLSVLVGALLIGTLLNGMTMMNFPSDVQNIIKSLALLGAIIADNRLHPRDEETARQGDI